MSGPPTMLAGALALAADGRHVFPIWGADGAACRCPPGADCQRAAKHPRTPRGFRDATTDPGRIERWWGRHPADNVGVWTGASSLVVLDIDGHSAAVRYGELLRELGDPGPPWCTDGAAVTTGRTGGMHLWFRAPAGVNLTHSTPWGADHIDIRAGNSYVLAPPSLHTSGRRYTWLVPPPAAGLPDLAPAWVAAIAHHQTPAERPATPVRARPPRDGLHGTRYGIAAAAGVLHDLENAASGSRNTATYTAARRVLDLARDGHLPDADHVLGYVGEAAARTGLTGTEIETTVASAIAGAYGGGADEHRTHARAVLTTITEVHQ